MDKKKIELTENERKLYDKLIEIREAKNDLSEQLYDFTDKLRRLVGEASEIEYDLSQDGKDCPVRRTLSNRVKEAYYFETVWVSLSNGLRCML